MQRCGDAAAVAGAGKGKIFVSYAGRDFAWAEWVAWQLRHDGYRVELDRWDWAAGDNFVVRLGEHEQARKLDEDTLARRRRVLGDDHPDTLESADNFAVDLHELHEPGEHEQARKL